MKRIWEWLLVRLFRLFFRIPPDNRLLFYHRDRKNFGFLSNFSEAPFELDGSIWPTAEHYYQAQKSLDESYREAIRKSISPGLAKRMGDHYKEKPNRLRKQSLFRKKGVELRSDWCNEVKLAIMQKALIAKFEQNAKLRSRLLATGETKLLEDSPKDEFWGLGSEGKGANYLGQLLMQLRADFRGQDNQG